MTREDAPIVVVALQHVQIVEPEWDVLDLVPGDVVELPIRMFHKYGGRATHDWTPIKLCVCDQSAPQNKHLVSVVRFRAS